MRRWTKVSLLFGLMLAPALLGALAILAAPKAETPRDEPLPEGNLTLVAEGTVYDGDGRHPASGSVQLYHNGTGYVARFVDYEARSGANVWFYLVANRQAGADEIEGSGTQVSVPGPGQATYRGQFNVPLPADFDVQETSALVAWDPTWNTPFARIGLVPAAP